MRPAARALLAGCLLAALFAGAAVAAQPPAEDVAADDIIALDSARSSAEFRVRLVWLVRVRGYFDAVGGVVTVDRFRSQAVVDAHIDAAAVRMGVRGYADWVKSPEFFDAAAHPDIHFVSDPFPLQRLRNGGELPGRLSMRGSTEPVHFTLLAATCPRPGYDCPIIATGTVRRSQFGMRSRLGTLGDEVQLRLRIFAAPAPTRLAP